MQLTHLDERDRPKMVDVSDKDTTSRPAVASGLITMSQQAYDAVINQTAKKGPVLQTAVIASILGTKKTSDLIPMLSGQTGVEMEALTGTSIGLLTIYDMLKAIDKSMVIGPIQLESKQGGKSGHYQRINAEA